MLPEMKRCLVRSPSGRPHVTVSFQSPAVGAEVAAVPGRHPVLHEGRAQGQHPHCALSAALRPRSRRLQVWRDCPRVILLQAYAGGLWGPLSKGSPASPAAGTGGTVLRLPLHNVGAGSQG